VAAGHRACGIVRLAILIFTVTLFIQRPLDFSAFPTILLASLMLRLSLNVSSTKLIIGEGHTGTHAAGEVIEGFANFVMGGSVMLGVVIFCVLLIVNFIVITKGAGRMAEVSARFALDGMPGKQLAIDSDMNAGAIDHAEAKARREREQQETTFFGSLDGASKFVKGDAVAGLLITLLNIIMGLVVGTLVHGMPLGRAFETYAILTVGDGLVSQIPAVIISVGAGLLLARGGATGATDQAIIGQLGRYPAALFTVALLMGLFALVPGMPFLPFVAGSGVLGFAAVVMLRRQTAEAAAANAPEAAAAPRERSMGDMLDLDDIHVEFAPDLVAMVLDPATGIDARIVNMRAHVAATYGLILPELRLTDDATLPPGSYRIRIHGVEQARDQLQPDRVLALLPGDGVEMPAGTDVREPVYGAPARWLPPDQREAAALSGATVVAPTEVLATHLLEVIKRNFARLLTAEGAAQASGCDDRPVGCGPGRCEPAAAGRSGARQGAAGDAAGGAAAMLLEERVSIRNLPLILEAISEVRQSHGGPEAICEHVRQRLGFQLVADLKRPDGTIPLIQLAPEWEETFAAYQVEGDRGQTDVALPPNEFNRLAQNLAERIARAGETGVHAAVVTSTRRRRFLRMVMAARGLTAPVLSFEEIGLEARPALVGMVAA
jgi:flagellar biosynthesis protein FlhA